MSAPPSPQRFAPLALWREASRLLVTLFDLFGEPQVLAFRHNVVGRDYKLILNWLRTVESLFRQLLLIEASNYAREDAPSKPYAKRPRERREMTFHPETPDAWRVTFRTTESQQGRTHRRGWKEKRGESYLAPTTFHDAWPLAERFEALLRVHNDPTPYAKRLARRLYAKPERIASIMREPPELQHRMDVVPHAEIGTILREASPRFRRDSS
jgi:hypothetical protein